VDRSSLEQRHPYRHRCRSRRRPRRGSRNASERSNHPPPRLSGGGSANIWNLRPEFAAELLHGYLEMIRLLGRRLGELHRGLASALERPEFAPEPISLSINGPFTSRCEMFCSTYSTDWRPMSTDCPPHLAEKTAQVRKLQAPLLKEFRCIVDRRIHATRIRCHGDCRLHQVLFTGKDFVFHRLRRPSPAVGRRTADQALAPRRRREHGSIVRLCRVRRAVRADFQPGPGNRRCSRRRPAGSAPVGASLAIMDA